MLVLLLCVAVASGLSPQRNDAPVIGKDVARQRHGGQTQTPTQTQTDG